MEEVPVRIEVDLREEQGRALDVLPQRTSKSRDRLIGEVIDTLLAQSRLTPSKDAFGLWVDRRCDGLVFQEQIRGEW